ncbi:MAG: GIY-YIG nuclease family protein [Bryobacterales bacterium]|nr:GIY-YIG nuclease family protein [Bryobacterales bacterium]
MPSATIKLFLVHGDAKRLRTGELSNWTGKAVAGPRSELDGVLTRDEAAKSGVYFLTGIDSESGRPAVYVGEAESIRDRLRGHLDKDFWSHVVFFTSKDENLTKAHIRYLEGRLIEQARAAGRAMVMNGQSSGAKLPESDREDMEIFLDRIHQLMPVLGADALLPIGQAPESNAEKRLLFCEIKGLKATGHPTPDGFVVLKGSQAVLTERASAHHWPYTLATRKKLIEDGTLAKEKDHLKFTRDAEFSSPSAAATVVHGGSANGLLSWKDKSGKTLKELEAV